MAWASMKLQEFREGDEVPEGSRLVHTRQVRGRYLREEIINRGLIWTTYRNVYAVDTVYIYEVPSDTDKAASVVTRN